jgi:GTPase SAR1 family protein
LTIHNIVNHERPWDSTWDQRIRLGDGFVIVYNVMSRPSFDCVRYFHSQIRRVKDGDTKIRYWAASLSQPLKNPTGIPLMLVGTNCEHATERKVSIEEGQELAEELGCEFVEVSASRGINVEKPFYDLVRLIREQSSSRPRAEAIQMIPFRDHGGRRGAISGASGTVSPLFTRAEPLN